MSDLLRKLRRWYDWKCYWLFWKSANRIFTESPGMAYLVELRFREWRKHNPLPESLMRSIETFFESQTNKEQP